MIKKVAIALLKSGDFPLVVGLISQHGTQRYKAKILAEGSNLVRIEESS